MKVLFFVLIIFLFSSATLAQTEIKLQIGTKLSRKFIPRESEETKTEIEVQRINVNDFSPFVQRTINGVNYIIAYNEKTRKIEYTYTSDKNFVTENGLRVGTEFLATADQLTGCPSWHTYASETSDGWFPIVLPVEADSSGFRWSHSLREKIRAGEAAQVEIIGFFKNRGGC